MALVYFNPSTGAERIDEDRLTLGRRGIVSNSGCEVSYKVELLAGSEERIAHCLQVKPARGVEISGAEPVIQVESINIGKNALFLRHQKTYGT